MNGFGPQSGVDPDPKGPGVVFFLLLQLLLGYGLACTGFLLEISLGGWQFWLSALVTIGAAFRVSRATGLRMLGLNVLMFVLTLYTFTYTHVDVSICHYPMAHFMADGWNPVREASVADINARFVEHGIVGFEGLDDYKLRFAALHIIVDPKFSQVLAAQLQAASGLFTAQGYPLWFMSFALLVACFRFARAYWRLGAGLATCFALIVWSNHFVFSAALNGMVDMITYAAIVIAALTLVSWRETKDPFELAVFFGSLVIAMTSKFTGLTMTLLLLPVALWWGWRERQMRVGLAVFVASLAIFCLLPYWTSAYWYGSPFYPSHTFRSDVETVDLTRDFIGNADACRMGYLGRMVYAWVSPKLAIAGCRLWYGDPGFSPQWDETISAGGVIWPFCVFLWTGVALSFCHQRNRATTVTWLIFISFLLMPVKFIGYGRYVAQVYAALVIAYFNFGVVKGGRYRQALAVLAVSATVVLVTFDVLFYWRSLRLEGRRQENLELMRRSELPYQADAESSWWTYILNFRLAAAGVPLTAERTGKVIDVDWPLTLSGTDLLDLRRTSKNFLWVRHDSLPRPIWDHSRCPRSAIKIGAQPPEEENR